MSNFIAFLVILAGLGVLAYLKVPKFKDFVDSKFKKPVQNVVDVVKAPFNASDYDVATPTPTEVRKPVLASPDKPVAPPQTLPGSGYSTVSPEVAAELERRDRLWREGSPNSDGFSPAPPVVVPAPNQILTLVSPRMVVRVKAKQPVILNTFGKSINVVGVAEGGFDSRFSTSTDFSTGAYGSGHFSADSAGFVTFYSEHDCLVHIDS